MTDPASTQGKFASRNDVTARFEGTILDGRLPWVDVRIGDVESELMFQVPSLRKPIDQIQADSVNAGDPDRLNRVKAVVADKVLDLYRNPNGPTTSNSVTTPDITTARSFAPDPTRGKVEFTAAELDRCRLHTPRRRFGSIQIDPGIPTRDRRCTW
ncbi:hypothetical protein [Mycobacterium avium]|uniref:hypothetical protein n=1 Tax=Mycobacterium avium TaxID=1764 RepID=UPI001CC4EB8E|nr:hypothetical protein [Mycobacterium avium]MBZ4500181.1 hypothetical protein [Mycobacterium avium subsp. hominissuis]MBZ4600361.1 hypothetical protein [Mycobacterium avium subsp. hominissuis]